MLELRNGSRDLKTKQSSAEQVTRARNRSNEQQAANQAPACSLFRLHRDPLLVPSSGWQDTVGKRGERGARVHENKQTNK